MLSTEVSYYRHFKDTRAGKDVKVEHIANAIRKGNVGAIDLKAQVEEIRNLATQYIEAVAANDTEKAKGLKTLISEKKKALQVFTGSGLLLDLDTQDVDADTLARVAVAVRAHKSTVIAFSSPSGGLKALVAIEAPYPEDHEDHELIFETTMAAWLEEVFPEKKIKFDPGKDVSRLCFMSYDPEIWVNEHVEPFRQVGPEWDGVFLPPNGSPLAAGFLDDEDFAKQLREGLEENIPGYKMTERAGGKWDGPCPRFTAYGTCRCKHDGFVVYPDGSFSCRGCIVKRGGKASKKAHDEIIELAFPKLREPDGVFMPGEEPVSYDIEDAYLVKPKPKDMVVITTGGVGLVSAEASLTYTESRELTAFLWGRDVFLETMDTRNPQGVLAYYTRVGVGKDFRYTDGIGWYLWNGSHWQETVKERLAALIGDVGRSVSRIYRAECSKTNAEYAKEAAKVAKEIEQRKKNGEKDPQVEPTPKMLQLQPLKYFQEWAAGPAELDKVCDGKTFRNNVVDGHLMVPQTVPMDIWDDKKRGLIVGPTKTFDINEAKAADDIHTVEWRPNSRDDFMTTTMAHDYDPDAECPNFERALAEALPDEDVRTFYQLVMGYALLGACSEHICVINLGGGRNGKTSLNEAIMNAVGGEYACTLPPNFLMQKHNGTENHPTELMQLRGKRIVHMDELPTSGKFDENRLKMLTGGGKIAARKLYENSTEFSATHTMFISTNHMASVRGTDLGIWRRLVIIPWDNTVPLEKVDTELPRKLSDEAPGIVRWLVQGALAYIDLGSKLVLPKRVTEVVETFREDQDTMWNWLNNPEYVEAYGPDAGESRSTAVYESVKNYYRDHNIPNRPKTDQEIKQELDNRTDATGKPLGIYFTRSSKNKKFRGITLAGADIAF